MSLGMILGGSMLVGFLWWAGWVERSRVAPAAAAPERASFDAAVVAKGAELAAIGNCRSCHTKPGGEPFAGGLPLSTPFGTIHSTNITPDPDTGIGLWSGEDFLRAMHDGAGRRKQAAGSRRRRSRALACIVADRVIARSGALERGCAVRVSARRP